MKQEDSNSKPLESNKARPDTEKVGRWADKVYSTAIMEYAHQSLRPDESNMYTAIFTVLKEHFKLDKPNELMLLDLAVNDYIRIKRIYSLLKDESDIITIITRAGQEVRKAHEAGYLINAIESQFRQNMKELLLTPREELRKTIGMQPKDFTDAIGKIIDVGEDNGTDEPGVESTKDEKTESGKTT